MSLYHTAPHEFDRELRKIALFPNVVLFRLGLYKKRKRLSWGEVASNLGVHKRTLLRWRQTERMSKSSARLVNEKLQMLYPEIYLRRDW